MTTVLEELYKHNLWANLCLIDACASLRDDTLDASTPGTYGSIRNTLTHITRSEAGYVAGINGQDRPPWPEEPVSLDSLRERLQQSGEALIAIAAETGEDRIVQAPFRGQTVAFPLSIFLMQVINHATDHRSQVCTTLTQQGITPPDLQGWTYAEARS